ncbi:hypothetical protein RB614_43810 [Phytohabitans sp. ZYX-F-186]|uniref:Uncharacterized protein n=1 Tax=Phytohabitans maris TaxID=3071409 RepID=A0ABU0ZX70_9ACTN|nr:hypothetical protein [Phytohabitans sp. ZYX-F-186]MDQ7911436.1 hypothetical protein [Phytohabitans sp. ZYX-F-186]
MRNVRRELSGAWRSLRYDLSRRSARRLDEATTEVIYPDYEPPRRPRRIVLTATTFGALSLAGAAGTYFAVVNGLSALASEDTAPPNRLPAVAGQAASPGPTARGVAPVPSPTPSRGVPVRATPSPTGRGALGRATVRPPTPSPSCACVTPPVPTPTSPPPVDETPDPPVSSSPPAPTASASPEPTPGPSDPPPPGG